MFFDKGQLIDMHENEFAQWESLLAGLSPAQIADPSLADGLSVKDTLAHLKAWQERTIARLEGALQGHAPHFPQWPVALTDEETRESVDLANAWIFETQRDRPWADIYQEWRTGFLRFLELLRAIPEADLRPDGNLAWLAEYELLNSDTGAYDYHHAEHREGLEAWLHKDQGRG